LSALTQLKKKKTKKKERKRFGWALHQKMPDSFDTYLNVLCFWNVQSRKQVNQKPSMVENLKACENLLEEKRDV